MSKNLKMLVRSCSFITLIKCLKGHRSLGSLFECQVVKYWLSQGHLLSCSGVKTHVKFSSLRIEDPATSRKGILGLFTIFSCPESGQLKIVNNPNIPFLLVAGSSILSELNLACVFTPTMYFPSARTVWYLAAKPVKRTRSTWPSSGFRVTWAPLPALHSSDAQLAFVPFSSIFPLTQLYLCQALPHFPKENVGVKILLTNLRCQEAHRQAAPAATRIRWPTIMKLTIQPLNGVL